MAVIRPGSIVADISGSVGAETYGRNQGGLYVKARAGPAAEPTAAQLNSTASMTTLSQAWSDTLTDQQRLDWHRYAHQFPEPNHWGVRSLTNGYNRFIAVNFPVQASHGILITASPPTAPPIGPPLCNILVDVSLNVIAVFAPATPIIPDDEQYRILVYEGLVVNTGVNYYNAPFLYVSTGYKTYAQWVAAPYYATSTMPLVAGQKTFIRIRIQNQVTFAISAPTIASTIIVA